MAAKKKYDWDKLFSREVNELSVLEGGVDYECSQANMIQMLRNEACKRKVRVRLSDLGDQIIVRILGAKREVRHTDKVAVPGQH